jgi:hypothetical protein
VWATSPEEVEKMKKTLQLGKADTAWAKACPVQLALDV